MNALPLKDIIILLIVLGFSIYVFVTEGPKGLSKIFFIFGMIIFVVMIDLVVIEGKTTSRKIWIIVTAIFMFCVTMFLFLRKIPDKSNIRENRNRNSIRKKRSKKK
jgi:drug/metabolite transporter (DMT)-like permease